MKQHCCCPTCGAPVLFAINTERPLKTMYANWLDDLELEGRSAHYIRNLKAYGLKHLFPFFGNADATGIHAIHVQALYRSLLKKRLASKTVKHVLDALRAFLNSLARVDYIAQVPRFPAVKVKPAKEKAWISSEAQAAALSRIAEKHKLIFRVLFESGIRPSEGAALKRKDLRDGGVTIVRALDERGHAKETKTGSAEHKTVSAELYGALQEHGKKLFPEAWLFTKASGAHHTGKSLYAIWKQASLKAGLNISLYQATRHSRASQARADIEERGRKELAQVLGHTSARTTLKHYALGKEAKI